MLSPEMTFSSFLKGQTWIPAGFFVNSPKIGHIRILMYPLVEALPPDFSRPKQYALLRGLQAFSIKD